MQGRLSIGFLPKGPGFPGKRTMHRRLSSLSTLPIAQVVLAGSQWPSRSTSELRVLPATTLCVLSGAVDREESLASRASRTC